MGDLHKRGISSEGMSFDHLSCLRWTTPPQELRLSESVASKKLSSSSIARTVGLLQSQSSEIALALRICAKADSNEPRYVSATDQARRFASASSAAPTSNPITTFA